MHGFSRFLGFMIIFVGCVTFLVGVLILVGLGALFSQIKPTSLSLSVSLLSLAAAAPTLLGGLVMAGFGQLILLVDRIAERLTADKGEEEEKEPGRFI